ncbi:MAG: peptide chain release factor-like protein [Phycisphaerales bacterium]|nr:peptide chain release factor-like protein [Phycisphaerales bacterium]
MSALPDSIRHPATIDEAQLVLQCRFRTGRVSGPGGQHRNKVETAVFVTHVPTGLEARGSERRSQLENRSAAIKRLRLKLAIQFRTPTASAEHAASPLWCGRRRGRKLVVSYGHGDYPALLAEALDVVTALRFDIVGGAHILGVSTSQLARLIRMDRSAGATLNLWRATVGLRPLSD